MRLGHAIELFGLGVFRSPMDKGSLQALPSKPGAHSENCRAAYLQGVGYPGVGPSFAPTCSLSSALSKIRAWVNSRAGARPPLIMLCSLLRSSPEMG
jgi:hypothetical protein